MSSELRILILEDVPADAELVERTLRKEGLLFSSKRVETREAFTKELKELHPDIILADHKLPSFDGLSALEIVKEKCPDVPFIFVTGSMGEEWAVETFKRGATDYVLKDKLTRLVPAVKRALYEAEEHKERKRAEEALIEQSRTLEAFFKHTITPLVILDKNFNFIRVNEAYARACQRDASEFPGHNHFEFYPSDTIEIFKNVVETKEPFQAIAMPFTFPDHPEWGETYWDWTLTPILDSKGEVEFLVFSLNDVTQRKKSEEELRHRIEELERFRKATIQREFRMKDLKDRVKEMEEQLKRKS